MAANVNVTDVAKGVEVADPDARLSYKPGQKIDTEDYLRIIGLNDGQLCRLNSERNSTSARTQIPVSD